MYASADYGDFSYIRMNANDRAKKLFTDYYHRCLTIQRFYPRDAYTLGLVYVGNFSRLGRNARARTVNWMEESTICGKFIRGQFWRNAVTN